MKSTARAGTEWMYAIAGMMACMLGCEAPPVFVAIADGTQGVWQGHFVNMAKYRDVVVLYGSERVCRVAPATSVFRVYTPEEAKLYTSVVSASRLPEILKAIRFDISESGRKLCLLEGIRDRREPIPYDWGSGENDRVIYGEYGLRTYPVRLIVTPESRPWSAAERKRIAATLAANGQGKKVEHRPRPAASHR